jgi:hypothetical protein
LIELHAGIEHAHGNDGVEYDSFALSDSWKDIAKQLI